MSLTEALADPVRKEALIVAGLAALDAEVDELGGIKGKIIETGYDAVVKLRPGFIRSNVEVMLPSFAEVIDPHLAAARQTPDLNKYFTDSADTIAEDLLGVTDARAERANNAVAKGIYSKMRGMAAKYVANAVPRLGTLANKHG